MTNTQPECDIPGQHHGRVRPYPAGPRCRAHTPAATTGRPEAPEPQTKETAQ